LLILALVLACGALVTGIAEQWAMVQTVAGLAVLPVVAVIGYRMIVRSLLAAE
jgi:hypothetical protein